MRAPGVNGPDAAADVVSYHDSSAVADRVPRPVGAGQPPGGFRLVLQQS